MRSFKKAFNIAAAQYGCFIRGTKNCILLVLMIFVYVYVVEPLVYNSMLMGSRLGVLEVYIAVSNNTFLQMVIPIVFLLLMSDFPGYYGESVFCIVRTGRQKWLASQILYSVMCAVSYVAFIVLISLILPLGHTKFTAQWSTVLTGFGKQFPELMYNFGARILDESTYFQGKPINVAVVSVLLMIFNLILLNLIQILMFCAGKTKFGIALCVGLEIAGAALCNTSNYVKWLFPTANSIFSEHFTKYFRKPFFGIEESMFYYLIVGTVLIFVSTVLINKVNLCTGTDK